MYCGKSCDRMGLVVVLVLLICGSIGADAAAGLPEPLKRCHVDDEACMVKQAQTFISVFQAGVPDRNIPPLLVVPLGTLRISSGIPGSSMEFNLVMTNTTLKNFVESMVFKTMKGFTKDVSKPLKITWTVVTSGVDVHANYDVKGKILILPIISQGQLVVKMDHLHAKTRITALPEKREDGLIYLKITDYNTIAKTSPGNINMTNLFPDNPELHDSTLKVLNDQYESISAEVQPQILRAMDRVFKEALQKFWDTLPYKEFFE